LLRATKRQRQEQPSYLSPFNEDIQWRQQTLLRRRRSRS